MKALVGWNTLYQVPELINVIVFFTRIKNDMHKDLYGTKTEFNGTQTDLYGTLTNFLGT